MDRNERKFKESVVIATGGTVLILVIAFAQEMVGFDKMNPGATPKKFLDVLNGLVS